MAILFIRGQKASGFENFQSTTFEFLFTEAQPSKWSRPIAFSLAILARYSATHRPGAKREIAKSKLVH